MEFEAFNLESQENTFSCDISCTESSEKSQYEKPYVIFQRIMENKPNTTFDSAHSILKKSENYKNIPSKYTKLNQLKQQFKKVQSSKKDKITKEEKKVIFDQITELLLIAPNLKYKAINNELIKFLIPERSLKRFIQTVKNQIKNSVKKEEIQNKLHFDINNSRKKILNTDQIQLIQNQLNEDQVSKTLSKSAFAEKLQIYINKIGINYEVKSTSKIIQDHFSDYYQKQERKRSKKNTLGQVKIENQINQCYDSFEHQLQEFDEKIESIYDEVQFSTEIEPHSSNISSDDNISTHNTSVDNNYSEETIYQCLNIPENNEEPKFDYFKEDYSEIHYPFLQN